jgi:tetratricopeptide (TPR) repeat protein
MALHAAVGHYGMSYTPDPESPLRDRDDASHEIDYIQFPRQTLEYRGGDCDDLSILYAALFQALGIETAFILVPGHVFLAFDLGLAPDEARRQLPRAEELIFRDERTWMPVETTALDMSFLEAWQTGARQWREASAREQAELLATSECWEVYEPVGLLGQGQPLTLPAGEDVYTTYHRELTSFIDQAIFPMVARIRERVRESENPLPYRNRLAVLYGRYGLYDRARTELEAILKEDPDYAPAIINLANIHLIHDEPQNALSRYEEALELDPDNPRVMLSIAKINHAGENYGIATRMLERAKQIDPVLAARFSYIEMRGAESTRASQSESPGESILWEETDE